MGTDILEIRSQVADLLTTARAMLALVAAQLRSPEIENVPEARWLLERLMQTLHAHIKELGEHLRRLGGRIEVRKTPRYAGLSLLQAGALTLETNARARGYSSTAALARRHAEELATIQARMRDLLPAA